MNEPGAICNWRCAKCAYHFANIFIIEGAIKEAKKCPKCKSLNTLSMTSKEINIKCISNDLNTNDYPENTETDYFE